MIQNVTEIDITISTCFRIYLPLYKFLYLIYLIIHFHAFIYLFMQHVICMLQSN